MRLGIFFFFFFVISTSFSQSNENHEFGKPFPEELAMTAYDKDPDADAVILYEKGNYKFDMIDNRAMLVKNVYQKIKILNDEGKEYATSSVFLYKGKFGSERLYRIKAVTNNGQLQNYLSDAAVFTKDLNEKWIEKTFTFPNVQKGSVLELEYTIHTPYFFNLEGWYFQNEIPTKHSEFYAEIPGYFRYNRVLVGSKTLEVNDAKIKRDCFYPTSGSKNKADCEVMTYIMKDIPAFQKEDYMLSRNNYISRIDFQLEEVKWIDGRNEYYTKSWQTVDREIRGNKNIGIQTQKNNFFKNRVPQHFFSISNEQERAKAVYGYIQDHFRWNSKYGIFGDADVKKAFDEKAGSVSEINLALINALQAVNIDAKIALLSTRENGIPTRNFAVMADFNYVVVHLVINGKSVFLDATDKDMPFGMLPFHCLNYDARVMDFKKGSYWEFIEPYNNNLNYINVQLSVDDSYNFTGQMRETNTGYNALNKRKELNDIGLNYYLRKKESDYNNLEIKSHSTTDREEKEKPLTEDYQILFQGNADDNLVFNPFLFPSFPKNPFLLEERNYPVDFGYPRKYTYMISLDLAGKYELVELPENKVIKFPDGSGEAGIVYSQTDGKIQMRFHLNINEFHFEPESYQSLKELFSFVVQVQNKTPFVLRKI